MMTRRRWSAWAAGLALAAAFSLSLAVAQTQEGLAEAMTGTSAGSHEPFVGRDAIGGALAVFYGGAFTDTHVEVTTLLADGNRVVLEFVYNGTNTGELMGMPPTDRRVSVPMLGIYEIVGDVIQYGRLYYDSATMMQQLGHAE